MIFLGYNRRYQARSILHCYSFRRQLKNLVVMFWCFKYFRTNLYWIFIFPNVALLYCCFYFRVTFILAGNFSIIYECFFNMYTTVYYIWYAFQINDVNTKNAKDCSQKYGSNNVIGLAMFLGIAVGNYFKISKKDTSIKEEQIIQ